MRVTNLIIFGNYVNVRQLQGQKRGKKATPHTHMHTDRLWHIFVVENKSSGKELLLCKVEYFNYNLMTFIKASFWCVVGGKACVGRLVAACLR